MSTHTFRGRPCCSCMAVWLPAYEAELKRRRLIVHSLDVYQLDGSAAASAGTHKGGAADLGQIRRAMIAVAREMGADAGWARTSAQGFSTPHAHLVLRGCPHNGSARYQIDAVDDGYNGLGKGGRGGRDDGPRPLSGRTWREGIAWAARQAQAAVLPYRVRKTRAELKDDIRETTAQIVRTKKGLADAKKRGEPTAIYTSTIASLRRVRTHQRLARAALLRAPKRTPKK